MADLRHDWYQQIDNLTIVFYISQVDPASVKLAALDEKNFLLSFKVKSEDGIHEHNLSFYGDVNVKEYQISCSPANISVTIAKAAPSSWPHLWHQDQSKVSLAEQPPRYPSSSKKKVDWDRLACDAAAEEAARAKQQQSVDDFFKQIYQNASEESRRAMNKSFLESQGTVLSTDWSEVGAKPVTPKAP